MLKQVERYYNFRIPAEGEDIDPVRYYYSQKLEFYYR